MYNKINVVLIVLNFVITNLNAMENELLLPSSLSSIAEVSRELDNSYNEFKSFRFSYEDIINKIDLLNGKYQNFVKTKKKEQQINFPEEKEGYSATKLSLNNQSIKTVYAIPFDLPLHIQKEHIQHIDISHNDLEDLPLGHITEQIPNLKTLNAFHNKIAYISFRSYSRQVKSDKLEELNVSNNALKDFNVGNFLYLYGNIKNVDLSENPIETITWAKDVCSPNVYPIINLQNTKLSLDAKFDIKKKYIAYLQAQLLTNIRSKSIAAAGVVSSSWLGTPWTWTLLSTNGLALIPMGVLGILGYYIAQKCYQKDAQQELDDIENAVSKHLLFDK